LPAREEESRLLAVLSNLSFAMGRCPRGFSCSPERGTGVQPPRRSAAKCRNGLTPNYHAGGESQHYLLTSASTPGNSFSRIHERGHPCANKVICFGANGGVIVTCVLLFTRRGRSVRSPYYHRKPLNRKIEVRMCNEIIERVSSHQVPRRLCLSGKLIPHFCLNSTSQGPSRWAELSV
jgi:hypothetical protein